MFKIIEYKGIQLEVHDNGEVYSVEFTDAIGRVRKRKLRKQSNSCGYRQIGIRGSDKKSAPVRVHRLVAQAFLPDWDESLFVDHIDLDKTNNDASNLRMVTCAENVRLYFEEQSIKYGKFPKFHRRNGYKHVSKAGNKFMAQMRIGDKTVSNGTSFKNEMDAACAVNEMCVKHNQPLCRFNVPLKAERVQHISPHRRYANWYTEW
jgi:hypothetical protein